MSYDPSAKYSRNDLMRLARVFGVHTTRGAPGVSGRNLRPRPTADLRAAIAAKGSPLPGRSLATSFQPSGGMEYTMYNLRYFAKQMKVPMTYRGRTKTKAELLKGLTLAAKGVMVPGVSTRKGTRSPVAGRFGKRTPSTAGAAARRPRSAPSASRPASASAATPRSSRGQRGLGLRSATGKLTRNAGAFARPGAKRQVVNRVAMQSLFDETPKTPVTMTTPTPVARSLSRTRSLGRPSGVTPTITPSRLMSPTPQLVSPTPVTAAAGPSRGAARRSARVAKRQQAAVAAAAKIPLPKM